MNERLYTEVQELYQKLTGLLIRENITVSTMESCTSGLIASLLTDTEGSSAVFPGALVAYCNRMKTENGVPREVIEEHSVYSFRTAESMAKAAADKFGTELGIGITGCFGNTDPANASGIPGTVYYAVFFRNSVSGGKLELAPSQKRQESKLEAAGAVARFTLHVLGEE